MPAFQRAYFRRINNGVKALFLGKLACFVYRVGAVVMVCNEGLVVCGFHGAL